LAWKRIGGLTRRSPSFWTPNDYYYLILAELFP
jgi:hypothetical protein